MGDRETIAYLQSQRARHPKLAETIDLHIDILESRTELAMGNQQFEFSDVDARLANNQSIILADTLELDWDLVADLAQKICLITAHYAPTQTDVLQDIAREFDNSTITKIYARAFLMDELSIGYHIFALNNALNPFLKAYAQQLASHEGISRWERGNCPICNGLPDIAILNQANRTRRLMCSQCDTQWIFHPTQCPFCNTDTHAYLKSWDKVAGYWLFACTKCQNYIKTIDSELARHIDLPAERVLKVDMDIAASQAGYDWIQGAVWQ